jgi:hypothetical protein
VSNPLSHLGISDQSFRAAAEAQGLWPAPTPLFGPTSTTPTNTNTLGKQTTATSGKSVCELYEIAKSKGQSAAIVASLKAKCDAAAPVAIASSGAAPIPAPSDAGGPSPIVLGAIALAVGVVGFVVYKRSKKSKR